MRKAIMKLRDDPEAASAMAAVLTQSNSFKLTGMIGRRPTDSELYMAHFMGVGGAAKLIANAEDNPQASAARLFPNAAAANRSIFYERDGRARSVYEVYANLSSRYASAANSPATQTALAMYGAGPGVALASNAPAAAPAAIDNAAYLSTFPDTRTVTPVSVTTASAATSTSQPGAPVFRSLFQADENAQPVSSTVRALWGNSSSLTSVQGATPGSGAPQPLDLFSDRSGTFSS
jgi:hypothetical protein